jgi:peptidoglycan/xylan/chitin deacetylase (PgdA/CDA1 family)
MQMVLTKVQALAVVVSVAGISAAVTELLSQQGASSPLTVTVNGRASRLTGGRTLSEAAAALGLRPRAGELLDVAGKPLRPDGDPGRLLVNGRAEGGQALLRNGDRITVVDGRDRQEALVRQVVPVQGGAPSDPQFTLSRAAGAQEIIRGAISHGLVSSRFRPTAAVTTPRAVALTFDDGPSPEYTPRILATLRRLGVRATFFVIGYLAQQYPAIVREEATLRMEVGNHTYNHPDVPPFDELPPQLMQVEISLAASILTRLGVAPRLFRPPGGSFSSTVVHTASALGERIVLWSVDPTDWTPGISAKQIARNVLSTVRPGSIVILHDGGGDRSATLAALPAIVRGIRARGLRLVTVAPAPITGEPSGTG